MSCVIPSGGTRLRRENIYKYYLAHKLVTEEDNEEEETAGRGVGIP